MEYLEKVIEFSYASYEVPFRCRKPRNVKHDDGVHTMRIPCYTDEEAPVVAVLHSTKSMLHSGGGDQKEDMPIRHVGGVFYVPAWVDSNMLNIYWTPASVDGVIIDLYDDIRIPEHFFTDSYSKFLSIQGITKDGIAKEIDEVAGRYAIVDGELYKRVQEPLFDFYLRAVTLNFNLSDGVACNCYYSVHDIGELVKELEEYGCAIEVPDLEVIDPSVFVADPQGKAAARRRHEEEERELCVQLVIDHLRSDPDDTYFHVTTPEGTRLRVQMYYER